jgi:hypothetical protein
MTGFTCIDALDVASTRFPCRDTAWALSCVSPYPPPDCLFLRCAYLLFQRLQHGGVLYYCSGWIPETGMVLQRHALLGMDAMFDYINNMLKHVPEALGANTPGTSDMRLVDELPEPKRIKLYHKLLAPPSMSAASLLAQLQSFDEDDVACMRDVDGDPATYKCSMPVSPLLSYYS